METDTIDSADIRNGQLQWKCSVDIRQKQDRRSPFLRDVIASKYQGKQCIVVADSGNQNIKTFWDGSSGDALALLAQPCKMTRISLTEGAATVGNGTILIFTFAPKLQEKQSIVTQIPYYGITWLGDSTFAASGLQMGRVDMLDMDGNVLKSIGELYLEGVTFWHFRTPVFLCTTSTGDVAVTDYSTRQMTVLNKDWEIVATYPRIFPDGEDLLQNPLGVAGSLQGDLFIVDREAETVLQVTKEGKFVRQALTVDDDIIDATCIFMDENDTLFIAVQNRIVKTFKFSKITTSAESLT